MVDLVFKLKSTRTSLRSKDCPIDCHWATHQVSRRQFKVRKR
jgi:hypothetical protein